MIFAISFIAIGLLLTIISLANFYRFDAVYATMLICAAFLFLRGILLFLDKKHIYLSDKTQTVLGWVQIILLILIPLCLLLG